MDIERPAQALLELIEADRARQCTQILGEAQGRAAALRAQAQGDAVARVRQAFAEQRQRHGERIAAAQARLATHRRLHEQQRTAALLRLAWERLPAELQTLWQQPDTRAAWVARTLAAAGAGMARGGWRIVHAPDWPAQERQAVADQVAVAGGATMMFDTDTGIAAGLKIVAGGNVIDGTLTGLLAGRAEIEARLLRLLENAT